jgi:hypothetical protein
MNGIISLRSDRLEQGHQVCDGTVKRDTCCSSIIFKGVPKEREQRIE